MRKDGPKGGALSKKLVETNRAIDQRLPEQQMPERIVVGTRSPLVLCAF